MLDIKSVFGALVFVMFLSGVNAAASMLDGWKPEIEEWDCGNQIKPN